MSDKLGVALAKEACPLCGKTVDGPILMNKRLTKPEADKVKALHGQVIGFTDEPCAECKELMTKGILLIGIIEAKTDDMRNPYRSGHICVVSPDYIKRICKDENLCNEILKKGATFMEKEIIEEIIKQGKKLEEGN